jgi:hypothetical protein
MASQPVRQSAAIEVARANGARQVVVATPVAPADVVETLGSGADVVVCLEQPDPFGSVGRWYRDFAAVGQAEVVELLAARSTGTVPDDSGHLAVRGGAATDNCKMHMHRGEALVRALHTPTTCRTSCSRWCSIASPTVCCWQTVTA